MILSQVSLDDDELMAWLLINNILRRALIWFFFFFLVYLKNSLEYEEKMLFLKIIGSVRDTKTHFFFVLKKSLHYFLPLAFCNYLSRLFWFSWEFLMLYLHSLCIIIQYASLFTHCCISYLQIIYIFSSIELYKRTSCFMFYGSHSTSFIYSTILCIIDTLGVINLNKHWNSFSWCT